MNKNNVVYLFPGQGAQFSGMAMDLLASDSVKKLFDTASEIFGKDAKDLLNSDADTLKRTDVSQPAITVANLAAAAFLGDQGYSPKACAGFSLGEYAALVCSGIINAADCFKLIKARGDAMQKAADKIREAAGGDAAAAPGMAAIVGLAPEQVEELIKKWSDEGLKDLYAANINSPKQLVVSGTAAALTEAEARFKEAGAKRVIRLQVAGPFHSPLMSCALDDFVPALESVSFKDPSITIFSNVTGKKISSGAEAKKLAVQHITCPVRWVDEEASAAAIGAEACLEVGPGKVLQGLWKDSGSEIPVFAAGTAEDINKIGSV
ncbi:MAG: ACP S-malonyltransferase [Treponema sp.]|nr:ACP S-malonyltransferase [Treponema sp.]MCL2237694.1 ACP S-malonyltransferase [Treponema sp.]